MRKDSPLLLLRSTPLRVILLALLLFVNLLTTAQVTDSLVVQDSVSLSNEIPIANDDLTDPVFYLAQDSIVYDAATKQLILFQKAQIKYQDIVVDANYINYEQDSSTLHATPLPWEEDSTDNHLLTKDQEKSKFKTMRFNFKSQRAMLTNAYSQYGEGFIKSEKIKRNKDQSIFGLGNIYTTCNLEHPHFGIAAKKVKIIPNKVAVSGSANLVVEDIPTPIFLPFGMFPLKQGQRSGFKLPTYDVSQNLGFGIREGGYYFAINDHLDLLALADIYALGTWRIGFVNNYVYRYRFRGNVSFNYAYNKIGGEFENNEQTSRNFFLTWSHQLDPNVKPGTNFSANVNLGSSRYHTNNSYDANFYLNNNYSSSISYSKTWEGKPFNLSINARHNQNTQTGLVTVRLPEINFSANQLYPLRFRKNVIKPRWYEKVTASYQLSAINELQFTDSTFSLSAMNSQDFRNGIKHSVPINATYNLFKYINANFTASYNEYWYGEQLLQSYDFSNEKIDSVRTNGFYTARDFQVGANFSTRVYGLKLFKHKRVKGIRHVMTPAISLNYRPDFGAANYGYYYNTFLNNAFDPALVSYYQGSIIGGPPNGRVGGVGFSLGNNLQMKVAGTDSVETDKKINLIDGLDFNTFYNMAIDSFNWSNLNITYRTTLMQKINVRGTMSYSPYAIDTATGARKNEFEYNSSKKPLRFERATLAVGASFPLRNNNTQAQNNQDQVNNIGGNYNNYVDFNIPYTLSVNYTLGIQKIYLTESQKDTLQTTQDMFFNGDINLTPKWKIGLRSGYNFATKNLTFTSFDIYRDLHCWEMRMNLIPFGLRKSYNFSLNVKASVLQDLKLIRRRDFRDNF